MRRQGLQHRVHSTGQKPILLGFVPPIRVGGATLACGGKIVAQVIEIDEILPLRPEYTLDLIGNPRRTIAYAVDLRMRIPADPRGTMGHLFSGLLRTPGAGAEYRIGAPLLLDESQTGLFPTGFTRLALIDLLRWIRGNHRDHGAVGSCD